MPQQDGSYSAAWRHYRLWSWAFWIVFVGYLPALAFVARVLGWAGEGNAIFLAAFVWMIGFALVGYQTGNFRCPRCGELFFRKFDDRPWRGAWQHNPFARRCMHCGLPKWAAVDPGPSPGEARPVAGQ